MASCLQLEAAVRRLARVVATWLVEVELELRGAQAALDASAESRRRYARAKAAERAAIRLSRSLIAAGLANLAQKKSA